MQPAQPNPQLAGMPQRDALVLAERLQLITYDGFMHCAQKCITHYGEDSIPYHPGEKACLDRCVSKVYNGLELAKTIKKDFETKVKQGEMPYQWMREAAAATGTG
ncbi:sTim1 [Trypanosoma theileri]|uniref:Mitochondrial import inner membrane translocase subunit n=1 Tax=Trypanosoma theileri TaxID=67003 RepID=A0A1X0NYW6_9TRYP|nr:sTim1 [Trypanosoma theileri]ORC89663.1 sTim1 [Trypanosoma theileri]